MKQTMWLSELSCLSQYTRLYPNVATALSQHIQKEQSTPMCVDFIIRRSRRFRQGDEDPDNFFSQQLI